MYLIIIEVGTDSREEAEEVAREASDDGRISRIVLAKGVTDETPTYTDLEAGH